jgi:hypothetical protein
VIIGAVVAGTVVVAVNAFWTDETWGPRYLVPVAWLLLIPIPWWATTRARRRILGGVAAMAVAVQLVAVVAPYEATANTLPSLVGYPIYTSTPFGQATVPFGNDSIRWIPQLSPILVQSALITSWVGMKLGAPPLTYTYGPFNGPTHHLTMNRAVIREAGIPDFYWRAKGARGALGLGIALILAAAAAALLAPPLQGRRGVVPNRSSR